MIKPSSRLIGFRGPAVGVVASVCALVAGMGGGEAIAAVHGLPDLAKPRGVLTRSASNRAPLWRALPTRSFAVLGEGIVNQRRWGVYAFLKSQQGRDRPCIENVVERRVGRSISMATGSPACGLLAPERSAPVTSESALSNVGGLILGMTVAPEVKQLELHFDGGLRSRTLKTRLLSRAQSRKSHLRQFRYIALGFEKPDCLLRSVGLGATGSILFESPEADCVP
jgi:hypothetical protein